MIGGIWWSRHGEWYARARIGASVILPALIWPTIEIGMEVNWYGY